MLQQKADKYCKLKESISTKKYCGSDLGESLFGYASSLVPKCGHDGLARIVPIIAAAVLTDAGIDFDAKRLVSAMPSSDKIRAAT
eukprot:5118320-Ditylum_brightwellii.AAC.1